MHFKITEGPTSATLSYSFTQEPDPQRFERHCHGSYELLYVAKGRGRYVVEGSEYPMTSHSLLLLRPYEYHYVCPERDHPYERYVINFRPEAPFFGKQISESLMGEGTGVYFPAESISEGIRNAFESLHQLSQFPSRGRVEPEKEGSVLLRSVLTQILLLLGVAHPEQAPAAGENLLTEVIGYINENLQEPLTLDGLSRRFFVSKYALCRAFREYTGTTFLSYVTTKRIVAARQMIEQGEAATDVAYRVGFRDYSSFYRAYRKQTGHAPAWERR